MLNRYNPLHMFLASYGNELNRIDFRVLKESSGNNNLSSFSYNGLIYSFNPEINMFVNQFGHAMDYAQAAALAASLGYSEQEFESLADNSDTDGGADRRSSQTIVNKNLIAWGDSPYGFLTGATAWPTEYDDNKGLQYYYPHITLYVGENGPADRNLVINGQINQNTPFTGFGYTGVGSGSRQREFPSSPYSYIYNPATYPLFLENRVPDGFTFGNSAHTGTGMLEHIIGGYSWIPVDKRSLYPSKLYSFFNVTATGVTGAEIFFRYNFLTQGNSFTNWSLVNTATIASTNGITGPNGVTTGALSAARINFSGVNPAIQRVNVSIPKSIESGFTYTASIFIQGTTIGDILSLGITGPNITTTANTGNKVLGTTWGRYQLQFKLSQSSGVTFTISGNDGGAGQWATQFNIWGAQIEEAREVDTSSTAHTLYLNTSSSIASSRVQSGFNSMWKKRKAEFVKREATNVFRYLRDRGFTFSHLILDDEGFYQTNIGSNFDSLKSEYPIEYNTFLANYSPEGDTWWVNYSGASAQPDSLFKNTSRFGQPGVTNFRDLLLLRGFTTDSSQAGYIDSLNFGLNRNKDSISSAEPSQYIRSMFQNAINEMLASYIDDAIITPFKEYMIGNTNDTEAIIANYGYVDEYAGFLGNTYLNSDGGATQASLSNIIKPSFSDLWPNTSANAASRKKWAYANYLAERAYSNAWPTYTKNGNKSSINGYGTVWSSQNDYGWYATDVLLNNSPANQISIINNMGARAVFDWKRQLTGNSYQYSGNTWGIQGIAAYVIGQPNNLTTPKQVHYPATWRGITWADAPNGYTYGCTLCSSSYTKNYRGVCGAEGYGRDCVGCNDQTTYVHDYFFNDLWGITEATEYNSAVNIIPMSLRAARNGYAQGQLTKEWILANGRLFDDDYFDNCGHVIPGVTMLPGTLFRHYDTHWYPLGWMGFLNDLAKHRILAQTEVYNALEARQRTGDPTIKQNGYHLWVTIPSFGIQSVRLGETDSYRTTDYEYSMNMGDFHYFKPHGITYDIVRDYWDGALSLRGATIFYGDINEYWAENIRHAYLHKCDSVEQWGNAATACIRHPNRTTLGINYNQDFSVARWPVTNPNDVIANHPFGASAMFVAPGGVSGFTLGGPDPDIAWTNGGYRLNKVLEDCNNQGGGIVHETMYLAPHNPTEKEYAISGAQLTTGMYLWRITFLHPATEPIYVKGSRFGDLTGVTYNVVGITDSINNSNHHRGIWWACNQYELPIVTNPPLPANPGLPAGTTTWNGIDGIEFFGIEADNIT